MEKLWNDTQSDFKINLDIAQDSNENIKTTYRTNLASKNPPDLVFQGGRFFFGPGTSGATINPGGDAFTNLSEYTHYYAPGTNT